jgi:hypothetical protein
MLEAGIGLVLEDEQQVPIYRHDLAELRSLTKRVHAPVRRREKEKRE